MLVEKSANNALSSLSSDSLNNGRGLSCNWEKKLTRQDNAARLVDCGVEVGVCIAVLLLESV